MHKINTENRNNVETQNVTWKTHNGGKNHDSPQAVKCTMRKVYNVEEEHRGNDLLSSSPSPHAAVTTRRQQPLALSLSLSHSVQKTS